MNEIELFQLGIREYKKSHKILKLNEELLLYLHGSIKQILRHVDKHNIYLENRDKLNKMIEKSIDYLGQYDYWSIGNAHQEYWSWYPAGHIVTSWEGGELDVRNDLSGQSGVGTIGNYNTGLSGYDSQYNVYFNSVAAQVELN